MQITATEIKSKGILQRENIRTMKKDLVRLREADALKESEKIIKTKTPVLKEGQRETPQEPPKVSVKPAESAEEKTPIIETKKNGYEKSPVEQVLRQKNEQEQNAIIKAKQYANEEERQKIFLLESQKKDLEKQIQAVGSTKEANIDLEKNKILLEQKNWQEKLNALIEEEKIIETQEKDIENLENQTNIPAERQALEKKRWEFESQRQKIEKKRWTIENELVKLENNIKEIDENYKIFNSRGRELKNKIAEIDNSLREIYSNISEEETERIEKSENLKRISEDSKRIIELMEKRKTPIIEQDSLRDKEYLKEISLAAREKLAESTKIEKAQRRKFMEDVERWAASHSNNLNE